MNMALLTEGGSDGGRLGQRHWALYKHGLLTEGKSLVRRRIYEHGLLKEGGLGFSAPSHEFADFWNKTPNGIIARL